MTYLKFLEIIISRLSPFRGSWMLIVQSCICLKQVYCQTGSSNLASLPQTGWGSLSIYGIVWMCVPNSSLFQRHKVYDTLWYTPFFKKRKYVNGHIFMVNKGADKAAPQLTVPLFLLSHLLEAGFLMTRVICKLVYKSQSIWKSILILIQRTVYDRSTFFETKYMNGLFFYRPGVWLGLISKYWLAHPYQNCPKATTPLPPGSLSPKFSYQD